MKKVILGIVMLIILIGVVFSPIILTIIIKDNTYMLLNKYMWLPSIVLGFLFGEIFDNL